MKGADLGPAMLTALAGRAQACKPVPFSGAGCMQPEFPASPIRTAPLLDPTSAPLHTSSNHSKAMRDEPEQNPMNHPAEQPTGTDGTPKFGRLLLILIATVLLIVAITFGSEAFYS